MKKQRLFLSVLFGLSLSLGCAAQTFSSGYLNYEVADAEAKTVKIIGYSSELPAEALVVPATVAYEDVQYAVTEVGEWAFCDAKMTSLSLPEELKKIGDGAFSGCCGMESVSLPATLENISYSTFSYCTSLKSIEIPAAVKAIGNEAFRNCEALKTVAIGANVEIIGGRAFDSCTSLKTIRMGRAVEELGAEAFNECKALASIDLPDSFTTLGEGAFRGCSSLSQIKVGAKNSFFSFSDGALYDKDQRTLYVVPQGVSSFSIAPTVESIGAYAFQGCALETFPYIPEGVAEIGLLAFMECRNLTDINLPSSVLKIGRSAFSRCTSLSTVRLGNVAGGSALAEVGLGLFIQCDALKDVYIYTETPPAVNGNLSLSGNVNLWVPMSSVDAYKEANEWRTFKVQGDPDQPIVFDDGLFKYTLADLEGSEVTLSGVKGELGATVAIPPVANFNGKEYAVTAVGDMAFTEISGIEEVNIPESVRKLGGAAFSECSASRFNLPETLEEIGASCFAYSGVTDIKMPGKLKSLGYGAFIYCDKLVSADLTCEADTLPAVYFYGCKSLSSVTLGNSLRTISNSVFYECESLASIDLPEGLESIDISAFFGCKALKTIHLPASLETVDGMSFPNTPALESITVAPGNLFFKSVDGVLYNYDGTTLVRYPSAKAAVYKILEGTETVGRHAFSWNPKITAVELPESVTFLDGFAFYACEKLSDIKFSENLTELYESVFQRCSSLTEVTLPESVKKLDYWVFSECTSLKRLNFGSNVELIGPYMLEGTQLEQLHISTVAPPETYPFYFQSEGVFDVYVPKGSVDAYKSVSPWNMMNIMSAEEGVEEVKASSCTPSRIDVYHLTGAHVLSTEDIEDVNALPAGIYIANGKKFVVP